MSEKLTYEELEQRVRELEKAESERKQAEDGLRNRETIIQSIFDAAPVGICIMKNRVYHRANRDWCESFGYQEENIIGRKTDFLYESEEEYERVGNELYEDLLKNGIAFTRTRLKRSDGEFRDVDLIAKPLNPDDLESGSVVVIHDITERKRMQEELIESEERYRLLAHNLSDVVWTRDLDFKLTYISPSVKRQSGFSVEEKMTQPFDQSATADSAATSIRILAEEIAMENEGHADPSRSRTFELEMFRKDGSTYPVETTVSFLRDEGGKASGLVGINRDITERKKLEEHLQQAQKMEAIGTLAGGIAHQFNNALSIITGNIDLLEMDFPGDENVANYVNELKASARRMTKLTAQLLAYGRGGKYQTKTVSLNDFVRDALPLFKQSIDSAIHVETDLHTDILNVVRHERTLI